MILKIKRFKEGKDCTIGIFTLLNGDNDIVLRGFTCEPAGPDTTERNKDRRIPQGTYSVDYHQSIRFKALLPRLYNESVPKDRFILIHAGNYGKDTEGCILLGDKYDNNGVYNSKATLASFLKIVKGKVIKVQIINEI